MKKLLILGGDHFAIPVVKAAHDLGCYVITCDYLPDNVAHKYSDEFQNASTIDKESVLEIAKKCEVDGIVTFTDSGVVTAGYVAEKLGLPSPGPYKSIQILQNKAAFRKFLTDNGFVVPKSKGYVNKSDAFDDKDKFSYPLIVKPVDAAGSKGVNRVNREEELDFAIDDAIQNSFCGDFIIEDFIEKKGNTSDCDCFSVDGEFKCIVFSSQRFDETCPNPYAPAAYSWPSSFSEEHTIELKKELQRLITLLGMKSSVYNVETREGQDGKAYIMEVSPRGGGNRLSEMVRFGTGVDMIKNAVRAALGMPIVDDMTPKFDGYWAEIILHSEVSGKFKALNIAERYRKNIVEEDLWVKEGDEVHAFTSARFAIGTVVVRFDSNEELEEAMTHISQWCKVLVK